LLCFDGIETILYRFIIQVSELEVINPYGSRRCADGKRFMAPKLFDWLLIQRNSYPDVCVSLMIMNDLFSSRGMKNFCLPM